MQTGLPIQLSALPLETGIELAELALVLELVLELAVSLVLKPALALAFVLVLAVC